MFSFLKRLAKKDSRDLEQVIFDVAEHRRDEDLQLFYRLMSDREVYLPVDAASLPAAAEPGVPYTTKASDQMRVKTVSIPDNGEWISAATQTSHPLLADGYVGMTWFEFLRVAQEAAGLRGALIQSSTSWVALDKESITHALGYSQAQAGVDGGSVEVPPGHKVNTFSPSTRPQVAHLESNFLLLDFGLNGDWRTLVSDFDERVGRIEVPPTVAILQGAMLDRLRAAGELGDFVAAWQHLRERGWQAVWVLPGEAAGETDAVESLKAAGFGVHGSAEDGACFAEVHKPDGTIVIGMPGPSL